MNKLLVLCVLVATSLALPPRNTKKVRDDYIDQLKTELREFVVVQSNEFSVLAIELHEQYDIEPAWILHVENLIKQFLFTLEYREITRGHIEIAQEIQKEMNIMKTEMAKWISEEDPLYIRIRHLVREFDAIAAHIDYISHIINEN